MTEQKEQIVIGIDPGTRVTGYGILRIAGSSFRPIDFGCIRPPASYSLSERYEVIFDSLQQLLERFSPTEMAIETQFVQKNAQSAIKLGIAMGCAILAAKKQKLKVFGYSPREVKCSIAGTGKASKEQLQNAVMRYLALKNPPKSFDTTDALAIALCHAHRPELEFLGKRAKREI